MGGKVSKAKTKTTGIEWTHDRVTLGELEPWGVATGKTPELVDTERLSD